MSDKQEHGTGRWAKKSGARSLAVHLERNDLDNRTKVARAVQRIRIGLRENSLEQLRDLYVSRVSRKEILAQQVELSALRDSADFIKSGAAKWAIGLWNSLRRDAEFLVHLPDPSRREVSLEDYLRERTTTTTAEPSKNGVPGSPVSPQES